MSNDTNSSDTIDFGGGSSSGNTGGDYHQVYEPSGATELFAGTPRFGHGKNVTVIAGGNTEEIKDYLVGLIFAGALAMGVFFVWGVVLVICMVLGPKKAGYWSGKPFEKPPPEKKKKKKKNQEGEEDYEEDYEDDEFWEEEEEEQLNQSSSEFRDEPEQAKAAAAAKKKKKKKKKKSARETWGTQCLVIRVLFMICCVVFVVFAILLVIQGMSALQSTVVTINYSASTMNTIGAEAERILTLGIGTLRHFGETVRDTLVHDLSGAEFCPADAAIQSSDTGREVAKMANETTEVLKGLDDFLDAKANELIEFAQQMQRGALNVERYTAFDVTGWKTLLILIPYLVVPCCFFVGAIFAMVDVPFPVGYTCLLNWFLTPMFVTMVALAVLVQGVLAIVAGMNADFCLPANAEERTPDASIMMLMKELDIPPDSAVYAAVDYYVHQCPAAEPSPLQPLMDYGPVMSQAEEAIQELDATLQDHDAVAELTLYCAKDFTPLASTMDTMKDLIFIMTQSVQRILDLFDCNNIVTIYTNTIYTGTCNYAMTAVFWIYSCTLVLSLVGMIMLTLRSSYKLTKDPWKGWEEEQMYRKKAEEAAKERQAALQQQQQDDYPDSIPMQGGEPYPDYDGYQDPNDPNYDPNYDPNQDPNYIGESYYDPNDPNSANNQNGYYDPNDPNNAGGYYDPNDPNAAYHDPNDPNAGYYNDGYNDGNNPDGGYYNDPNQQQQGYDQQQQQQQDYNDSYGGGGPGAAASVNPGMVPDQIAVQGEDNGPQQQQQQHVSATPYHNQHHQRTDYDTDTSSEGSN